MAMFKMAVLELDYAMSLVQSVQKIWMNRTGAIPACVIDLHEFRTCIISTEAMFVERRSSKQRAKSSSASG